MVIKYAPPCVRCGWRFATFHICLDLPLEVMRRVENGEPPKRKRQSTPRRDARSDAYRGTDEWRENISTGLQPYHAQRRAENRERDLNIIKRYSQDYRTVRQLADEFEVNHQTVLDVLHRARDNGVLVMRPPAVERTRS